MKIIITWHNSILSQEQVEDRLIELVLQAKVETPQKLRALKSSFRGLVFEASNAMTAISYRDIVFNILETACSSKKDEHWKTTVPFAVSRFITDDGDQTSMEGMNELLAMHDSLRNTIRKAVLDLKTTRNTQPIKEIGDIRRRLESAVGY